jgi:transposase-like protein
MVQAEAAPAASENVTHEDDFESPACAKQGRMFGYEFPDPEEPRGPIPQHCEAYPILSVQAAAMHLRKQEPFCEWFDEQGGLAGQMDVELRDDRTLYILYSFGRNTYLKLAQSRFDVHTFTQRSGRPETRAHCPRCHKFSLKLYYRARRWACQRCQSLVERRTLLKARDKLVLRREALIRQVHGPQPTRGFALRERARRELYTINDAYSALYVNEAWPVLEPPLNHALQSVWFRSKEDGTEAEEAMFSAEYLTSKRLP